MMVHRIARRRCQAATGTKAPPLTFDSRGQKEAFWLSMNPFLFSLNGTALHSTDCCFSYSSSSSSTDSRLLHFRRRRRSPLAFWHATCHGQMTMMMHIKSENHPQKTKGATLLFSWQRERQSVYCSITESSLFCFGFSVSLAASLEMNKSSPCAANEDVSVSNLLKNWRRRRPRPQFRSIKRCRTEQH